MNASSAGAFMHQDAVIALIAEMKAKARDPRSGELTQELITLVLESVLPDLERRQPPCAEAPN